MTITSQTDTVGRVSPVEQIATTIRTHRLKGIQAMPRNGRGVMETLTPESVKHLGLPDGEYCIDNMERTRGQVKSKSNLSTVVLTVEDWGQ